MCHFQKQTKNPKPASQREYFLFPDSATVLVSKRDEKALLLFLESYVFSINVLLLVYNMPKKG